MIDFSVILWKPEIIYNYGNNLSTDEILLNSHVSNYCLYNLMLIFFLYCLTVMLLVQFCYFIKH